jgi:cytochrome P450
VIQDLAARQRADHIPRSDILDAMMRAQNLDTGDAMPDFQVANEAMTLVVVGHETTAGSLNWLWYLLARHPEVDAKLVASLDASAWSGDESFETLTEHRYTH